MSKERKDVLVAWLYPTLAILSQASLKVLMTVVGKKKTSLQRAVLLGVFVLLVSLGFFSLK